MPRHIAIIMDGNGRWATRRGLPRFEGHRQGGKTVERIVECCLELGVECLTLYSFSLQNWKRPKEEVDFLMWLYAQYLVKIRPTLMENNVRLAHLGLASQLPESVQTALSETVAMTASNTGMVLALALNYGSRTEIVEAIKKIAQEYKTGTLGIEDIDDECVSAHLDTAGLADPDLVIRTSNELRISNFLLWQISYSEFYVTDTLWPDFDKADMDKAIIAYAGRNRRFGDVVPKK
jgi:undecaprenyl diphosphate synthase